MHNVVSILTALSLLQHTVLGCCSHGAHGPCACQHGAHADEHHLHGHDPDHERQATVRHEVGGDGSPLPSRPCRCHCEGNRCQAIASSHARVIDAPDVAFDVLPPLQLGGGLSATPAARLPLADTRESAPALPVRAHLLYQSLLI